MRKRIPFGESFRISVIISVKYRGDGAFQKVALFSKGSLCEYRDSKSRGENTSPEVAASSSELERGHAVKLLLIFGLCRYHLTCHICTWIINKPYLS